MGFENKGKSEDILYLIAVELLDADLVIPCFSALSFEN